WGKVFSCEVGIAVQFLNDEPWQVVVLHQEGGIAVCKRPDLVKKRLVSVENLIDLRNQSGKSLRKYRFKKLLLVPEVVMEECLVYPGLVGYLLHPRSGQSPLVKNALCSLQNEFFGPNIFFNHLI